MEGALASSAATRQVLHTLVVLGPLLTDFLYLVIPNIAKMVERQDLPVVSRRHAIDALGRFARDVQVAGTSRSSEVCTCWGTAVAWCLCVC